MHWVLAPWLLSALWHLSFEYGGRERSQVREGGAGGQGDSVNI